MSRTFLFLYSNNVEYAYRILLLLEIVESIFKYMRYFRSTSLAWGVEKLMELRYRKGD